MSPLKGLQERTQGSGGKTCIHLAPGAQCKVPSSFTRVALEPLSPTGGGSGSPAWLGLSSITLTGHSAELSRSCDCVSLGMTPGLLITCSGNPYHQSKIEQTPGCLFSSLPRGDKAEEMVAISESHTCLPGGVHAHVPG